MDHYKLVMPEHLNNYGKLFGGQLLKWVDEVAYIALTLEYPDKNFVTVSLNDAVFKHQIENGQILRFNCTQGRVGNTSVTYLVKVYSARSSSDKERVLFENTITFVCIGSDGKKRSILIQEDE